MHVGAVEVTNLVHAYQRMQISTRRVIEVCDLDLPPRTLTTRACWYTVPLDALLDAGLEPAALLGTVHAAEHGLIGLLPLFTICDRWDVGGVSMAAHPQTGRADDLRVRRLPRRRGHRRARVRRRGAARRRDARAHRVVPL